MDEMKYLIRIAELKRSGLAFFLDHYPEDRHASYLKGQYDALAQIMGEIERLHPGIVSETFANMGTVAPKWSQHEAQKGLAALFDDDGPKGDGLE